MPQDLPVPRLSIAMTTYNGAAHLQEQLDSILAQTLQPHELQIGDDGSSDATHDILRAFQARAPFPVHLVINQPKLGFADNFLSTAARCSGDWIVFCDQDDVWLADRLGQLSQAIQTQARADTMLIVQTTEVVDGNLSPLGTRLPQIAGDHLVERGMHPSFWVLPGMLQTIPARLVQDFNWRNRPRDLNNPGWAAQAHDAWTCMMANTLGSVLFLAKPVILYRRHQASVTGYVPNQRRFQRLHSFLNEGNKDYAYLKMVAEGSAASQEALARAAGPQDRARLQEGAADFRLLARVLSNRGKVWAGGSLWQRSGAIVDNIRLGAYAPRRGFRQGRISLIKDLIRLCYR